MGKLLRTIIFITFFSFLMNLSASQSDTFEKWDKLPKNIKIKILNDNCTLKELVQMYTVSKSFLSLIKDTSQHKDKTRKQIKDLCCASDVIQRHPFLKETMENILNFINKELQADQYPLSQVNIFNFSFLEKCNLCLEDKYLPLKNDASLLVKKESIWGEIDAVGLPLEELLYYYGVNKLQFYPWLGDNESFNIIKTEVCSAFDFANDSTDVYVRCKNNDDDSEDGGF